MPDVKKGEPSVEPGQQQLPQGEATQLNKLVQAAATRRRQPGQAAPTPAGVDLSGRTRQPDLPNVRDEYMAMLLGPSDRPEEHVTTGLNNATGRQPVPREVLQHLPALVEAAKDPNAPPQLHVLLALINYHLNS